MSQSKKISRKVISVLLSLMMVFWCFSGMSLTAYADGTTYNPASTYTGFGGLITNDTEVTISEVSGKTWYVIANDSSTVTLLSKESFENKAFNSSGTGNNYATSEIKRYVDGLTGEGQPLASISSVISDLTLIDKTTAQGLTATKRKGAGTNWWLCSPGFSVDEAAFVYGFNGDVDGEGNLVDDPLGVRPALKLDLSKVVFDSETKTFSQKVAHTHTWDTAWTKDATYHWHACTGDGATDACLNETEAAKAEHSYGDTGDARFTCTVCGYVDTTKQAAAVLADAKTAAKADLDTLLDGKTEADYDADDWTTLTQAIANGKTAIDNATTINDVATAKSNAETSANAVKTTAEKLADAKTAAKADLDTLLDGKTEADYDADDWTTLTQAIANGKTAIDNATTINDVATAKSNAETSANAVKTTAEKLADAKTAAKADLDTLLDGKTEADYDADDWTTLTQAIANGKTAIDNATTIDDVATAKSNAETSANAVKTTAEKKEEADTAAANGVSDTINNLPAANEVTTANKNAIEAARKAYDDLTDDQKAKVDAETLKKLTDAEKAYAAAKEADDTAKAKDASDKIAALPKAADVTTKDEKAIKAARAAYDALSDEQKAKVPAKTVKKLEDAEKALAQAKELAAAKKNAKTAMNEQVTVTQKGKKITVEWKRATKADGYFVYVQYCGKDYKKPVKTIKKNSTTKATITKINGKKINLEKHFKVYVAAYKIVNGKKVVIGKSMQGHIVGIKNKKHTNVKSIKATKKALTVKVGKTVKAKAKITLVDKKKKHIPAGHGAKFRYRTSNKSIATVDKNGKIKGIKKGTCTIYIYSINGKMTKIKVTVK